MSPQIEKNPSEKKRKKIVSYNLTEDLLNSFNSKVLFTSRSKTIENLISNFVNNGDEARKEPHGNTARKTKPSTEQGSKGVFL